MPSPKSMPPWQAGRRSVGMVLDPGKEAAEPPDRNRGGERRGKAQPCRPGDAEPPLQDLDRKDRAGEPADEALPDVVDPAEQQIAGAGGERAEHHAERGKAHIGGMQPPAATPPIAAAEAAKMPAPPPGRRAGRRCCGRSQCEIEGQSRRPPAAAYPPADISDQYQSASIGEPGTRNVSSPQCSPRPSETAIPASPSKPARSHRNRSVREISGSCATAQPVQIARTES